MGGYDLAVPSAPRGAAARSLYRAHRDAPHRRRLAERAYLVPPRSRSRRLQRGAEGLPRRQPRARMLSPRRARRARAHACARAPSRAPTASSPAVGGAGRPDRTAEGYPRSHVHAPRVCGGDDRISPAAEDADGRRHRRTRALRRAPTGAGHLSPRLGPGTQRSRPPWARSSPRWPRHEAVASLFERVRDAAPSRAPRRRRRQARRRAQAPGLASVADGFRQYRAHCAVLRRCQHHRDDRRRTPGASSSASSRAARCCSPMRARARMQATRRRRSASACASRPRSARAAVVDNPTLGGRHRRRVSRASSSRSPIRSTSHRAFAAHGPRTTNISDRASSTSRRLPPAPAHPREDRRDDGSACRSRGQSTRPGGTSRAGPPPRCTSTARWARSLVGMSTVLKVIAARRGYYVLGLSALVCRSTAAGVTGRPLRLRGRRAPPAAAADALGHPGSCARHRGAVALPLPTPTSSRGARRAQARTPYAL